MGATTTEIREGTRTRNAPLDALRAFVTLLVVAHHAALAYTTIIPHGATAFTTAQGYWQAFPVVDPRKWAGFNLLIGWNDIFFMSLMFFVSGIFVWPSLERKGSRVFLKDRLLRLGLPFAVAAVVVAPLAYYPTYLLTGAQPKLTHYARAWMALGNWPSGPAWFVWVLLAFDCVAALLFTVARNSMEGLGAWWTTVARKPMLFYSVLVVLSAIAYGFMIHFFGSIRWLAWGPFSVQASRILLYGLYFLVGVWVGMKGRQAALFDRSGVIARQWWIWAIVAIVAFAIESASMVIARVIPGEILFAASCAASSFGLLAIFVRFSKGGSVWASLSANAYGIYLLHYMFVSWLQYAVIGLAMPVLLKFAAVLAGAIGLSWGAAAALRRVPRIGALI